MTVTIKDKQTEKEEHYHDFTYFELSDSAIIIGTHNNFQVFSREHFEVTRIKYNPKWV
jgi:hypothetical protein